MKNLDDIFNDYLKIKGVMDKLNETFKNTEYTYTDILEGLYLNITTEYMSKVKGNEKVVDILSDIDDYAFAGYQVINELTDEPQLISLALIHACIQFNRSLERVEEEDIFDDTEAEITIKIKKDKNGKSTSNIIDFESILNGIMKNRDK